MVLFDVNFHKDFDRFKHYMNKVSCSKNITKEVQGDLHVIKLDDIEIRYTIPGCNLTVYNSKGDVEFKMLCAPRGVVDVEKKLQEARFKMFCELAYKIQKVNKPQAVATDAVKAAKVAYKGPIIAAKVVMPDLKDSAEKMATTKGAIAKAVIPQKGM